MYICIQYIQYNSTVNKLKISPPLSTFDYLIHFSIIRNIDSVTDVRDGYLIWSYQAKVDK